MLRELQEVFCQPFKDLYVPSHSSLQCSGLQKAHHVEPGNASAYLGIQPLLQGFMEIADRVFGIRVQSTPLQQGSRSTSRLLHTSLGMTSGTPSSFTQVQSVMQNVSCL